MSGQNISNPGISLMKTIVMSLTGEIEYEGIKMEGPGNFKLFSQVSFNIMYWVNCWLTIVGNAALKKGTIDKFLTIFHN